MLDDFKYPSFNDSEPFWNKSAEVVWREITLNQHIFAYAAGISVNGGCTMGSLGPTVPSPLPPFRLDIFYLDCS